MKKLSFYLLFNLIFCVVNCTFVYSQVSVGVNFGGGTDYVGWDISMLGTPLEIQTTAPDDINFSTGATFRMTIGGASGFVGIGSTLTIPSFQLDVNNNIGLQPKAFDEGYCGAISIYHFLS